MKNFLKVVLPTSLLKKLKDLRTFLNWRKRGYLENAPQFVKEHVFSQYGIPHAQWIETGTYMGTTTNFLLEKFGKVHTIEPSKELFDMAGKRFSGKNVTLYNDVSENIFPKLLPSLEGDCNFWLDGHYSAGVTFKGNKDCPVEEELLSIEKNISNFTKVSILIDDTRCFLPTNEQYSDYPSIDFLVDWARKNKFNWRIEQDIFIMRNFF